jgi:ribosomal protein L29
LAFRFLARNYAKPIQFVSDMKRMFVLSTLICLAIVCSCQKQDSTAEAQLAQRKAELDTREKALDEREKALVEREKALANSRIIPARQQARNPAEVEAEREKRLQQLPPELRALIPNREQMNSKLAKEREPALQGQTPDPEQAKAEREKRIQELPPEFQAIIRNRSLNAFEEERRKKMNAMASPNAESSDTQPDSPSPSPTPQ